MQKARRSMAAAALTAGLVLGTGMSAGAVEAKPEVHPEWGKTSTKAHVLKKGCHTYSYRYSITPPEGEWGLETFIVGPGRVGLAHDAFVIGTNPTRYRDKFRVCSVSTRPGIFKIRAKLSIQAKSGMDYQEGWLPVTRFRLR